MVNILTRAWGVLIGEPKKAPVFLRLRSAKWFVTLIVTVAAFTDIFLYAVIVPVLPFALTNRMHVSPSKVQLWTSIMLAVYGGSLLLASPFFGYIADITATRRAPLLVGLTLLTGATVILCVAKSVGLFIVGRILQGLSGAMVWTTGLALLVDTVGKESIAVALGWMGTGLSFAVLLGPMLGGIVFDAAGYYAVFAMCFAVLGIDIFLRLILVERKIACRWIDFAAEEAIEEQKRKEKEEAKREAKNAKAALKKGKQVPAEGEPEPSTPTTLEKDIEAGNPPPSHASQDDAEKIAIIDTDTDTVPHDTLAPERSDITPTSVDPKPQPKMLPIFYLLVSPRFLAVLYGNFVVGALMTAFDSTLPIFVKQTFHWSSLGAGLIFLAMMVPSFFSPLVGLAVNVVGTKVLSVTGFLLSVPFLCLLYIIDHNSLAQKILLCVFLFGLGISIAFALMPLMAEITYAAEVVEKEGHFGDKSAYAQAYGLFNTAFAGGILVGPIWGGGVQSRLGFGSVGWTLAIWSFTTGLVCLFCIGGQLRWATVKQTWARWRRGKKEGQQEGIQ